MIKYTAVLDMHVARFRELTGEAKALQATVLQFVHHVHSYVRDSEMLEERYWVEDELVAGLEFDGEH